MEIPSFEEYLQLPNKSKARIRLYQRLLGVPIYHGNTGRENKQRGQLRPGTGAKGPRPGTWYSGPDPIAHDMFIDWHRHRAQAHYRGEEYYLTYGEYMEAWGDLWSKKGRGGDDMSMTRTDPERPWQRDNVEVITRREQIQRARRQRALRTY